MKKLAIGLFFLVLPLSFAASDKNCLTESLQLNFPSTPLRKIYEQVNQDLVDIDQIFSNKKRVLRKIELADMCIEEIKKTYSQSDTDRQVADQLSKIQKQYHDQLKRRFCCGFCVSYCANSIANRYVDKVSSMAMLRLEILGE